MNLIKYIVYTSDLCINNIISNWNGQLIPALDPRSALYIATGICAQNNEKVIVILNSSNSSRSAFSGLTEAFYRNLPIILLTVGKKLDYSVELNDVVNGHFEISSFDDLDKLLLNHFNYPIHIELNDLKDFNYKIKKISLDWLSKVLSPDDYFYFSHNFNLNQNDLSCKVVVGGMDDCDEGALSNVLGASLAKKRRRYIGLVTETEFLHDMNALGNINVNDSLIYIVYSKQYQKMIQDFAKSLDFFVDCFDIKNIDVKKIKSIINNGRKSIILIEGEC